MTREVGTSADSAGGDEPNPVDARLRDECSVEATIEPGAEILILGGGQLGRMLCEAASRLGMRCAVYSDAVENPAFDVAARTTVGAYDDTAALLAFARGAAVATYEFENVPVAAADALANHLPVRPGPLALRVAQDRLAEKRFISERCGQAVAPFQPIDRLSELPNALAQLDGEALIKTRRFGYDGKGQARVRAGDGLEAAAGVLALGPCIVERRVSFACEVSVLNVRSIAGENVAFDIPWNEHSGGILRRSTVPSGLPDAALEEARSLASRIADELGYVGVLAVELFYCPGSPLAKGGSFLVNEIAPRVHNSGHWTQDGCVIDQFEAHIRAIAGWPIGDLARHSDVVMHNLIGDDMASWRDHAARPSTALHLYGKSAPRPGRKMGHVNVVQQRTRG